MSNLVLTGSWSLTWQHKKVGKSDGYTDKVVSTLRRTFLYVRQTKEDKHEGRLPTYLPLVRTMGQRQSLVSVIVKLLEMTGWKFRRRGYRSNGLNVPDVITTVWKRSKTGFIASDASKQLNCQQQNQKYSKALALAPVCSHQRHFIQISVTTERKVSFDLWVQKDNHQEEGSSSNRASWD